MRRFKPTVLALLLIIVIYPPAFAGHIAAGKVAGNIPAGRTAGHIPLGRSGAAVNPTGVLPTRSSRFDLESAISSGFAGLLRMLLESGSLL
jgi:hypothetical protein